MNEYSPLPGQENSGHRASDETMGIPNDQEFEVLSTLLYPKTIVIGDRRLDPKILLLSPSSTFQSFVRFEGTNRPEAGFLPILRSTVETIQNTLGLEATEEIQRQIGKGILSGLKRFGKINTLIRSKVSVSAKSEVRVTSIKDVSLSVVKDPNENKLYFVTEANAHVAMAGTTPWELASFQQVELKMDGNGNPSIHFSSQGGVMLERSNAVELSMLAAYWSQVLSSMRPITAPHYD